MERQFIANTFKLLKFNYSPSSTTRPFIALSQRNYSSDEDGDSRKRTKERLNELLNSIVNDSKKRSKEKDAPKIEFKLAVPIREKVSKPVPKLDADKKAEDEPKLSPKLMNAVKSVAQNLKGDPQIIESELIQKLKSHQTAKVNMSELFEGMKIDKPQQVNTEMDGSKAQRVRKILDQQNIQRGPSYFDRFTRPQASQQKQSKEYAYTPIDIFGAKPLGIFLGKQTSSPPSNTPTLTIWDKVHEKELKLAATHPPANGFEEMILWTEQGKLWQFPIDNEQGLDESETKYDFTDHVFLDPVIESWCPKKGPVKHFMELVTVALSKNPYLSVPEKKEYLNWYHEYFKGKSHILKEVGAGEVK